MSSNLSSSSSQTSHRSAAASAVDALSGVTPASALVNRQGNPESDQQAFARWMAQYKNTPSQAPPTLVAREAAKNAYRPPVVAHQVNVMVGKQQAAMAPQAEASQAHAPKANGQPKVAAKPADAPKHEAKADKASAKGAAKTGTGAKADEADTDASEEGRSLGDPPPFATPQGEATAYVKELQPPPHVSATDPAAMLAWLSSFAQTQGAAKLTSDGDEQAASTRSGGSGAASAGQSVGRSGLLGADTHSLQSPQQLLSDAVQAAGQGADQGGTAGQGSDEREGALNLQELGMTEAKASASELSAATFGALMNRELQRTPEGLTRQEATHHTASLPTPMDSPAFPQALADRVGLWVNSAGQDGPMTAELRLNPAEMGPVHIRIEIDGQTAQVDFAAQALETRRALESSIPLLAEALSQAGLSLSGGGVSDQSQQAWAQAQSQGHEAGDGSGSGNGRGGSGRPGLSLAGDSDAAQPLGQARAIPRGRAGGLDLYA